MKKSSNRGFMLLETLIVSTVILGTLIFLYTQFTGIKTSYDISFKYNTIPGLYHSKQITTYFEDFGYQTLSDNLDNSNTGFINITANTSYFEIGSDINLYKNLVKEIKAKTILFVNDDLVFLKEYLANTNDDLSGIFSEGLKDFILKTTTDSTNQYRVIIEFNDNTYATVIISNP